MFKLCDYQFKSLLQSKYQLAIQAEGMIGDMVRYLSSPNIELKKHCASAIFKVRLNIYYI